MQHHDRLIKKNKLIIFSYIVFFLFYITTVMLHVFTYNVQYIVSTGLFFVLIYLLKLAKASPKVIQVVLVVCLNVLILLLISQSFYILNLYWLIFYLIIMGYYQSIRLLITTSIVVAIELLSLTYLHIDINNYINEDIKILIALAAAMLLIGIIQTIFIQYSLYTMEKDNQEKLQKIMAEHAYLQLFFKYSTDSIAVFDLNNKIIDVNPAFEKLYGWSRKDCINTPLPLVPPKYMDAANERFHQLLEGKNFTIESEEMKKDGTVFKAQTSLSPLLNDAGKVMAISVITRDITFMKENERLQMQSEKLKLAGEIAAGVAHEIRNPMTVISGFVQMMQADAPLKDYVSIVLDEIERIDLIISEFLVLSRPQTKEKQWVDLVELIHEIQTFYELQLLAYSITFTFKNTLDDAYILGNKDQLKQVFINLMKNSIEAITEDGTIEIILSKQEHSYLISIKDSGCGIPNEVLEHIFEPFYTTKSKGTGLGMMITNKIIQEHQGSIKVFSKENKGTDIHIQLCFNN